MSSTHRISINVEPPREQVAGWMCSSNLPAVCSGSLDALSVQQQQQRQQQQRGAAAVHAGGRLWSYSDAAIATSSSSSSSPEHKLSRWKLYKLRDELEHVYCKLKHKRSKFNKRISELRERLHNGDNISRAAQRHIKVEYVDNGTRQSHDDDDDDDGDTLELPDHNYSASLQLTDLRDGCFTAELPLDALPTGHITIRIRNYKMEVIVGHRGSSGVDDDHCITHPVRYGDIDIPIYVNPATLNFEIDDEAERLYVSGFTKGCGLSCSDSDLHVPPSPSMETLAPLSRARSFHRKSGKRGPHRRALHMSHSVSD